LTGVNFTNDAVAPFGPVAPFIRTQAEHDRQPERIAGHELTGVRAAAGLAGYSRRARRRRAHAQEQLSASTPVELWRELSRGLDRGTPMDDQNDDIIKQMRVREVAAVFHSRSHLDRAVEALLTHGFDRADLSIVEGRDEIRTRLGGVDIPAEDLADIPAAPRRALIDRGDFSATLALASALAASVGAIAAVWYVIDANGGPLLTTLAAAVGGVVAGGAAASIVANILRRRQDQEEVVAMYGLVLCVRVRSPEQEEKAQMFLREHGGSAIRVHEIEVAERARDIPLSSLLGGP
jgi:hypothetical protein